jgi:hypothetical protein
MSSFDDDDDVTLASTEPPREAPEATSVPAAAEVIEPVYPDVYGWVEGWLLPHWRRKKQFWEETWWEIPEVLSRFEALWRAWEALRLAGPLGMSVFWRDHLETHMKSITAPDGPFWQYRSIDKTNVVPPTWPSAPADRQAGRVEYTPGMPISK